MMPWDDPGWKAQLSRRLLSDEMGLAILGVLGTARGISYFPPLVNPDRSPAHLLEMVAPPPVWGVVWVLAGAGCLAAIAWRRSQPIAVGTMVGMHFLWAFTFVTNGGRGWVTSIIYLSVFGLAFWGFARGRREPELVPEGELGRARADPRKE